MRQLNVWGGVVALVLVSTAAWAQPNEVLVAVQPASESLTRARQQRLVEFLEWAFNTPMTTQQRTRLGEIVVSEWRNPAEREDLMGWLEAADEVDKHPAEERPLVREKLLEVIVPALREAAKTDQNARWFFSVYEAANKPLVPGKPALTRQAVEATLEMLYFTLGKAHGFDISPSQADVDTAVKEMVASWPKLSADQKKGVAGAPLQWADLRAAWNAASKADRDEVAAGWRKAFPLPEVKPSPFSTTPAQRKAVAKLKEIDDALEKNQSSPAELKRFAVQLAAVVSELRADPNTASLANEVAQVQTQLERVAQQKLSAEQARAQVSQAQTRSADTSRNFAASMAMMQAHRNQMQFMEQMRQSQFNMISNMGNGGYQYTNTFGRPY